MEGLPDYAAINRDHWNAHAHEWVEMGERAWRSEEPSWGMWSIPESELQLLPDDMAGMRAVELGCGTAYISAWLARRGAEVVGIDLSEGQLATAARLAEDHGVELELIHGNAEVIPFPDETFDFAVSEYGVAIWADPYVWVPEVWRALKPGGELVMLGNHPLLTLVMPVDEDVPVGRQLLSPYFGMHRTDWAVDGDRGVDFNLPISEWFRLFTSTGFDVLAYHELQAPQGGEEVRFLVPANWAHDYPSEQIWKVRKR